MAELWRNFCSYFWSENFWFPGNVTWNCLRNKETGITYPHTEDLWMSVWGIVVILILRFVVERYIASPLGISFGLPPPTTRKAAENPTLEKVYKSNRKPTEKDIEAVSKQTDLTVRQIERWFRLRRKQNTYSLRKRFNESFWKWMFYSVMFIYGVIILWDQPCVWDNNKCWVGYPNHHISDGIYWYYMIELSFYLSGVVSAANDVKRKDFWTLMLHHATTIMLITLSWIQNWVRIGSMVLVIHDIADVFLEAAKMGTYIKWQRTCDTIFIVFTIIWFVSRLLIFPFKVVWSTLFNAVPIVGFCSVYWLYNGLLITLQILNIVWFVMIVRIAYKAIVSGGVQGDVRSDTDDNLDVPQTNGPKNKVNVQQSG